MTTPPFDDNPFRSPSYAQPAPMPPESGQQPVPHWFTTKVKITLVACVVAALGLGALGALGFSWVLRSGPPSDGDCLYLSREGAGKLAYHRVGCREAAAIYQIDNTYRGAIACASDDYVRFRLASGQTLCLALNVSTGDCLRDVEDEATIAKVSCADPRATERAEVIIGSGAAGSSCTDADDVLVYRGPPARVVCLTPPGENI
ncbi:hypothetical protein [Amycolatopsis tolypomycina]|uniref:Uncharacterized protein n=1 Tax=Amycolatopsis tolypomycina TaxID=208445 RepID=A0A1H5D0A6_9PSEU|nr:hypothetical protein [Amycolatopsis tolypomycina]SED72375.1 hypothetical protein SAMN04489727_9085 [Amycolatopsis tolypomycina]